MAFVLLALTWSISARASASAGCTAHGQAALSAWSQGKYDQVGKNFAPAASEALPPAKRKQAWTGLQKQWGEFKSLGKLKSRTLQGHDVLMASMTFASMSAAALVACDDSDQIIGLRVVPADMVPPAAATASTTR